MGNDPNKVLQCGVEEAKNAHRNQIFKNNDPVFKQYSHAQSKTFQKAEKVKKFMLASHENLTQISFDSKPDWEEIKGKSIYEEPLGKGLDTIIQQRYHSTMHFPEPQVVSLLETLAYSLHYLSKKQFKHSDFYPTNIFYQNGKFKLRNPAAIQISSYSITKQRKRFSFLSPQLIKNILKECPEDRLQSQVIQKGDVFAIGMILLEFCTLLPSSDCYDEETYELLSDVIQQRIIKCSKIYNPLIGHCLDMMLQQNQSQRISAKELAYQIHAKLNQIQKKNLHQNLQPRMINQISPNKIHPHQIHPPQIYPPQMHPQIHPPQIPQISQPFLHHNPQQILQPPSFRQNFKPQIIKNQNLPLQQIASIQEGTVPSVDRYEGSSRNNNIYPGGIMELQSNSKRDIYPGMINKDISQGSIISTYQLNSGRKDLYQGFSETMDQSKIPSMERYMGSSSKKDTQIVRNGGNYGRIQGNYDTKINDFQGSGRIERFQQNKIHQAHSPNRNEGGQFLGSPVIIKSPSNKNEQNTSNKLQPFKLILDDDEEEIPEKNVFEVKTKEESLEERVQRILSASKDIQ